MSRAPRPSVALSAFDPRLGKVAAYFQGRRLSAYLFGGAVRDALLGAVSTDLDVAVNASPEGVGPGLADLLGGTYFTLDADRGIGRVAVAGDEPLTVDITRLATEGPTEETLDTHLRGRDFTIGALAVALSDLVAGVAGVIDPVGGLADLRSGVVRALSESALEDDPIRLLRGPRLAATTGFGLDRETSGWIKGRAHLLSGVSAERVRDELVKILAALAVTPSLRALDELGLLTEIFPELEAARGVVQPQEHHYDVFDHMVETPGMLELIVSGSPAGGPALALVPRLDDMEGYFAAPLADGATRATLLKLACLLHDVAKPVRRTVEPTGRIRFFGHGPRGSEMVREAMTRLRFSRRAVSYVATVVEYHLRPGQVAPPGLPPSGRAVYRYHRDLGDVAIDTVYLNLADYLAAKGPDILSPGYDVIDWKRHCGLVASLLDSDGSQGRRSARPPLRLISGDDLMGELSLRPGPVVGELLELVEEARAVGEVGSRSAALNLARKALESGHTSAS